MRVKSPSKKKTAPAAQLSLNLNQARTNLHEALDQYTVAAVAAVAHPELAKEVLTSAKQDSKALRKQVNRMVCRIAAQSGRDHREIFILAYHTLFKRTGVHVVAEAARLQTEDRLSIAEEKGILGDLMSALADMITAPGFAPTVDPCTA